MALFPSADVDVLSAGVDQSIVTGHQQRTIQMTTKNISVQDKLTTAHRNCLLLYGLKYSYLLTLHPDRLCSLYCF